MQHRANKPVSLECPEPDAVINQLVEGAKIPRGSLLYGHRSLSCPLKDKSRPSAGTAEIFAGPMAPAPASAVSSWGAVYTSVPTAATACVSAMELLSTDTLTCPAPALPLTDAALTALSTGVTCGVEACGAPADLPEGESFLLPFDLGSAATWQEVGLGIVEVRRLLGEPTELSAVELAHIEVRPPGTGAGHSGPEVGACTRKMPGTTCDLGTRSGK